MIRAAAFAVCSLIGAEAHALSCALRGLDR